MPEEIKAWFKSMARLEAQKAMALETLMDQQQLLKMGEAERLCETKLANAEDSLRNIDKQLDWLRRFTRLTGSLEQSKKHLYEVNKQYAALMNQARELERFETFEAVQGRFQRIRTLESAIQDNKRMQTEMNGILEATAQQMSEAEKKWEQQQAQRAEAEKRMYLMQDAFAEGHRIKGAQNMLGLEMKAQENRLQQLKSEYIALEKETQELEQEVRRLTESFDQKRIRRQALEIHQRMLEKGEVIQLRLDALQESKNKREQIQRLLARTIRRQNEENETLNRLFTQHQDLDAQIRTLQNELHVHRQSNFGQDSYSLQKRALELKIRKQQFMSALSLWIKISEGYAYIEEKSQQINRMRLHTEHQANNIEQLESNIKKLRAVCEEKKYAYTLSKSQDVIRLRSDLREGTACSVCGATHHPYHSDTMLEQSKLISDIKTDYELLAAELKSKEALLAQMKLEHAEESGCLHTEREALNKTRGTHEQNVKEWEQYSTLDRSFKDCSPSTNMEARAVMLKQFIEKISQDAETAQKELDTFNFHQSSINHINEQISQKEMSKNEIVVRLNEVNTGCQVMAGQVEQQQQRISKANETHSRLYEELDKLITFTDWYGDWESNPENLKIRIQQQMELWNQLNEDMRKEQMTILEKSMSLQAGKESIRTLEQRIATLEKDAADMSHLYKEKSNTYQKIIGTREVQDLVYEMYQTLLKSREQEQEQEKHYRHLQKEIQERKGALQAAHRTGMQMEEHLAEERSELDLWIRRFNASHPPVQYAELERVFSAENEWGSLREEIRRLKIELSLAQTQVNELQSALIAHQAENIRPSAGDATDLYANLIAQKEELEKLRKNILKQIAVYDARRQAHERATEQMHLYRQALNNKLHA